MKNSNLSQWIFKKISRVMTRWARLVHAYEIWYYTSLARRVASSCGQNLRVNYKSKFTSGCSFGNNCNFNGMVVRGQGTVVFGNNFHSGQNCRIITSNHNYDCGDSIPYDATNILKKIIIEDNVWLGDCVIIVGNVVIGEGAICAAGAVITKDVPKCAIVGGNPARVIKYRDMHHYYDLKAKGRFL